MPCFLGVSVAGSRAQTRLADDRRRLGLENGNDRATLPVLPSSCRFDRDKAKKSVNGSIGPCGRVAEWNRAKLICSDPAARAARPFASPTEGSPPFPTLS